jgi:hypothetical protein
VKDVAFEVENCVGIFKVRICFCNYWKIRSFRANIYCRFFIQAAVNRGAQVVKEPWEESDENGKVIFASIQTVCGEVLNFDWWYLRPGSDKLNV